MALALIFGLLIGFAVAAMILSSACNLVRVQPPDFFFGMVICFIVGMAVFTVQVAAGVAGTFGAGQSLASLTTVVEFQRLLERGAVVGFLFTPFVSAGIYSAVLRDCSFRRGLLIWVAQFVVIAIFLLGIWALIAGLGLTGRH